MTNFKAWALTKEGGSQFPVPQDEFYTQLKAYILNTPTGK
jgi:hypothetical protein